MSFKFTADDFLDFTDGDSSTLTGSQAGAIARGVGSEIPISSTSASEMGYSSQQASTISISAMLQGVSQYKDQRTSLQQQDHAFSNITITALAAGGALGDGYNEAIPISVMSTMDEIGLAPGDIADQVQLPGGAGSGSSGSGQFDYSDEGAESSDSQVDASAVSAMAGKMGFINPLGKASWRLSSPKGMRNGRPHEGIDMGLPKGNHVYASLGGKVTHRDNPGGYGWYIEMHHSSGIVTRYAHLSQRIAANGSSVPKGALIGLVGGVPNEPGAGSSTGAHLHFEIRINGRVEDPLHYIPFLNVQSGQKLDEWYAKNPSYKR